MVHSWCQYAYSFTWEEMLMLMKWMCVTAAWCILSCSCIFGPLKTEYIPFGLLVSHRWGSSTHGIHRCSSSIDSSSRMIGILPLTIGILRIRFKVKKNEWVKWKRQNGEETLIKTNYNTQIAIKYEKKKANVIHDHCSGDMPSNKITSSNQLPYKGCSECGKPRPNRYFAVSVAIWKNCGMVEILTRPQFATD